MKDIWMSCAAASLNYVNDPGNSYSIITEAIDELALQSDGERRMHSSNIRMTSTQLGRLIKRIR
jgi:hypothetical protein